MNLVARLGGTSGTVFNRAACNCSTINDSTEYLQQLVRTGSLRVSPNGRCELIHGAIGGPRYRAVFTYDDVGDATFHEVTHADCRPICVDDFPRHPRPSK